jgi:hypothetical protein
MNRMSRLVLCLVVWVALPLAAHAIEPAEGASLNYIHVLFEWTPVPSVDAHELLVVEDDGSADPFAGATSIVERLVLDPKIATVVESGLQFDQSYAWRVRGVVGGAPLAWGGTHRFDTLPLPADRPSVTTTPATGPLEPGLTLFAVGGFASYAYAVDEFGSVVWFIETYPLPLADIRLLPNGNMLFLMDNEIYETRLDGTVIWDSLGWVHPLGQSRRFHHEVFPMPNGNYLSLTKENRNVGGTTYRGDIIVEIDRNTLATVWSWNTFDHYSTEDWTELPNWTHGNAAVYD